jgi:hypothetical protein
MVPKLKRKSNIWHWGGGVVQDTLDLLKQRMGWGADEAKLSSIDTRDARIGQTLIYEFDIQVGSVVIPLRLSEEVTSWQYLQELPAPGDGDGGGHQTGVPKEGAVNAWRPEAFAATLAPFEVAGPVDLWIQDAEELRLAMPVRSPPPPLSLSRWRHIHAQHLVDNVECEIFIFYLFLNALRVGAA